jgi:hypothetical protein
LGATCAKVPTPFAGCLACHERDDVTPRPRFPDVRRFFGAGLKPFAGTKPSPVNIAACVVAAMPGFP